MEIPALEEELNELVSKISALPDIEEPPKNVLEIIGRGHIEPYWNELLAYFIDPEEPHGFGKELLKAFLSAIDNSGLIETLDDVSVSSQAKTEDEKRADLVIYSPSQWFVCVEMKVRSGGDPSKYEGASEIGPINVSDFPEDSRKYIYLAKEGATLPTQSTFREVYWKDVIGSFEEVIAGTSGKYPVKSYFQLIDFMDTVKRETSMENEFDEAQMEKAQLYLEYHEEIEESEEAFDAFLEKERSEWKLALKELNPNGLDLDEWELRENQNKRWQQILKEGWHRPGDEKFLVHFEFYLDKDQFENEELRYELHCEKDPEFKNEFNRLFHSEEFHEKIEKATGGHGIKLTSPDSREKVYTEKFYTNFYPFDLHKEDKRYEALKDAFEEHLELAEIVDDIIQKAREKLED